MIYIPEGSRVKKTKTQGVQYANQTAKARFAGIDLAIVMDTTGSMGYMIQSCKDGVTKAAKEIAKQGSSIELGFVEYKDHPPEDIQPVIIHQFSSSIERFELLLDDIKAIGGGDGPEAVLDGIVAGTNLQWRDNAIKLLFLIGDAPPHGFWNAMPPKDRTPDYQKGDHWPEGCPDGLTYGSVGKAVKGTNIQMRVIPVLDGFDRRYDNMMRVVFRQIADACGAEYREDYNVENIISKLVLPKVMEKARMLTSGS